MRLPTGIGVFVPVDSPMHRTHAIAKMGLVLAFTIGVFGVDGAPGLIVAALMVVVSVQVAKVPWRVVLRGIRALAVILTFTLLAHALSWQPATVALLRLGPVAVDGAGLAEGIFFAGRIALLVVGTSLLTLTTPPVDLADGLERVMRPMSRVGVPAHELAMMLTIALRFIPTTAREAEKVVTAQVARGARFGRGGPLARARAYLPVLVPLFVSLFKRADELATAMEARCYRGGAGRTRLRSSRMRPSDWALLVVGTASLAALAWFL